MAAASSSAARQLPAHVVSQLSRARSLNPRLNAFTHLYSPEDLAAQLERAPQDAPLSGTSLAVKDMFATADGAPTSCGSRMLKDYRSPFDATVVKRVRDAGALLVGKTNMDEFGMGSANVHSHFGAVLNPAGPHGVEKALALAEGEQRVAGGSSGGSAAAVASGLCDVALASDTGGSTRLPASYCGVLGLKPSYGLLSRYGLVAYASSLDTVGIMAREVDALRRTFDAASAYDPKDPTSTPDFARQRAEKVHAPLRERLEAKAGGEGKPLQGVRIGVPADLFPTSLLASASLLDPIRAFLRTLTSLGASLTSVRLPSAPLGLSAYYVLASAEASSNLARYDGVQFGYRAEEREGEKGLLYARTRTEGFGKEVRKRLLLGTFALSAEAFDNYYLQAQRVRRLIQLELDDLFRAANPLSASALSNSNTARDNGVDFLLHPSAMSTAPLLSSYLSAPSSCPSPNSASPVETTAASRSAYVQDLLSLPASLAGLPALSIPAGRAADDGWPVGVTLVGQWGADGEVLEVARKVEEARKRAGR
ncbi:Trimeric GatFAB AmidoTransferase(AdT) complex subunit [Rhodotorula kratochvilovae]